MILMMCTLGGAPISLMTHSLIDGLYLIVLFCSYNFDDVYAHWGGAPWDYYTFCCRQLTFLFSFLTSFHTGLCLIRDICPFCFCTFLFHLWLLWIPDMDKEHSTFLLLHLSFILACAGTTSLYFTEIPSPILQKKHHIGLDVSPSVSNEQLK